MSWSQAGKRSPAENVSVWVKGHNSVADPWLVNSLSGQCAVVLPADVVHL